MNEKEVIIEFFISITNIVFRIFQNFGQQQFDFSNKKNTDGNINDMLYSGGGGG